MTRARRQAVLFCLTVVAVGCGYRVVGTGTLFGAQHVVVMPFAEEEPLGLAPDLLQELSSLVGTSGVTLRTSRGATEAVLEGDIRDVRVSTVTAVSTVVSYRMHATIEARLVVRGKQEWQTRLSVSEDFLPARGELVSNLTVEASRREALVRLAQNTARELHAQLMLAGQGL